MSSDDSVLPFTPEERGALRRMLRDPAAVKEMFNQTREILTKGLEQFNQLRNLAIKSSSSMDGMDDTILNIKTRLDLNDVLETVILNQIQMTELLKKCFDAIITNNPAKLKELRQQMDY